MHIVPSLPRLRRPPDLSKTTESPTKLTGLARGTWVTRKSRQRKPFGFARIKLSGFARR